MKQTFNKVLSIVLIVVIMVSLVPTRLFATETNNGNWSDSVDITWFDKGNKKSEYTLSTPQQLAGFASIMSMGETYEDITIKLSKDINLEGRFWNSAGLGNNTNTAFMGTFDGRGNTIHNMSIQETNNGSGFIRALSGATVKNLVFTNVDIKGNRSVGTVSGFSEKASIISNVKVDGNINCTGNWVGGITGNNNSSIIENCNVMMNIYSNTGTTYGLLAGWSGGTNSRISNSIARGNIYATDYCGGAVGSSDDSSYNGIIVDANVSIWGTTSAVAVGGLLGYSGQDRVFYCKTSGTVKHEEGSGGLVGGLIGTANGTNINLCSSYTTVLQKAEAGLVGGLVGNVANGGTDDSVESSITNSYATGDVTGHVSSTVGGLVGVFTGYMSNCYASGNVVSGGQLNSVNVFSNAGGLIGSLNHNATNLKLENCYATGNVQAGSENDKWEKRVSASALVAKIDKDVVVNEDMINCYYNLAATVKVIGAAGVETPVLSGTAKTTAEMKSASFANDLGGLWMSVPGQYPTITNMKNADYTVLDQIILNAEAIDPTIFIDMTEVENSLFAVMRNHNISEQETVNGYAVAIENAIKNLAYKGADYTKVKEAIAKIPTDLTKYTDETVKTLNDARNAVIVGKNIMEQDIVTGYAIAIENAIKELKLKHGFTEIVSIDTGIRVENVDGSSFDSTTLLSVSSMSQSEMDKYKNSIDKLASGFVLGELYDIKILKDGKAIQPNSKVKVSIPLTDKMKSMSDLKIVFIDGNDKVTIISSEVKDGMIIFVTDHFSYYGVIGKEKKINPVEPETPVKPISPETGDNTNCLLTFVLIVISGGFVVFALKKKKSEIK